MLEENATQPEMQFCTLAQVQQALEGVLEKHGLDVSHNKPQITDEWLNTRRAKELLTDKGYRVVNDVPFKKRVKGVQVKKENGENWYKTEDLLKIPSRV